MGYKFSHEYVYYYLSKAFDSLIKNPDKSKWADYCGEYDQLVKDFRLEKIWMKDGDLYGKASNEIRDNFEFKLLPIGENKFGRAGGSVEITFGNGCLIIDDIICKKIS